MLLTHKVILTIYKIILITCKKMWIISIIHPYTNIDTSSNAFTDIDVDTAKCANIDTNNLLAWMMLQTCI